MNYKAIIAIICIALLTFTTLAYALPVIQEWYHPHTVTITKIVLAEYLEGTLITNGTTIAWGNLNASETYMYNYTVKNSGTLNCTITLSVVDLPAGWTLTWAGNNTFLAVGKTISKDLILTIPASAEGIYSWNTTLQGHSP